MRALRSIQARVVALVVLASAALWIAVAVMTWREARHELDELLDAHLAQAAALLVTQQGLELDDDHRVDAPVLHRYAPRVVFQVFHEGRLALRSANAPREPIASAANAGRDGFQTVRVAGASWRVFAARGAKDDVLVLVAEEERARASILAAVLRNTVLPWLLGLPVLALALWWSIRRALRPMNDAGRVLAARRPDDFSPLQLADAPSEMAPMVGALNQLFARVAALLDAERRFVADAAHELRTPIAAIRAQAQVAAGEPDPARRRHALDATVAGCDRAARLAEQLLALSRIEALRDPARERLDLAAAAHEVVAELAGAAEAKQQRLSMHEQGGCEVIGHPVLLRVLLRNLVDNAIRYAPPGAPVEVSLRGADGFVELAVEDGGPGVADEDLARLGQRFFRVLGHEAPGTGLGLSIVQRIAELHGSEVRYARSRLGGLCVSVAFRRAPAPSCAASPA